MKIPARLAALPEKYYILIFLGVFLVCSLSTYFFIEDARMLEKKIRAKQKDVFAVLQLKDAYDAKKRAYERTVATKTENRGISLGLIEEIAAKSFIGGTLTMLQPSTVKEDKGKQHMVVEMKVTNAPLGEIITFVKAAEQSGLYVGKMRLSLPAANPSVLDMQATVMERYVRG